MNSSPLEKMLIFLSVSLRKFHSQLCFYWVRWLTITQAICICNSQNKIQSVLMVHKSCINPSVTSLSLDERNVAELLATGWDRHTGWNGCLTAESKSFPREATSQKLWVHVSCPVLCVFCVWPCSQLYGVSIIFSSMQSMFWTPLAVWSSPGWVCFNRVSFCSYSFGIATCFSAWMHT